MQALNPLAVAFVGLGPALDLAGELGDVSHDVEAGFEQGQEQDVAVDAGGFQGDGGDAAGRSQSTSCRSPAVWAGNSRTVSEPSGVASTQTQWLASPTSMPAAWACWTGSDGELGARPRPRGGPASAMRAADLAGRGGWAGAACWRVAADGCSASSWSCEPDMGDSTIGGRDRGDRASGGGVGTGTSRPNGIHRDRDGGRRWSPNEWAENRSPAQSNQRAERATLEAPETYGHRHRTPEVG